MSMPKGCKVNGGYATVDQDLGGLDYRIIAERMTDQGDEMNHATARNVFLRAMKKFVTTACKVAELSPSDEEVTEIAKNPMFQSAVQGIIHDYVFTEGASAR